MRRGQFGLRERKVTLWEKHPLQQQAGRAVTFDEHRINQIFSTDESAPHPGGRAQGFVPENASNGSFRRIKGEKNGLWEFTGHGFVCFFFFFPPWKSIEMWVTLF